MANKIMPWSEAGIHKSEYIEPRALLKHYMGNYERAWAMALKADCDLRAAAMEIEGILERSLGHE